MQGPGKKFYWPACASENYARIAGLSSPYNYCNSRNIPYYCNCSWMKSATAMVILAITVLIPQQGKSLVP